MNEYVDIDSCIRLKMQCARGFSRRRGVMSGRIAKAFMKFIAPVIIIAAMGSRSLIAGAEEVNYVETIDAAIENGEEIAVDAYSLGEDSDSLGMDVCFYIRVDGERTTVPNEPMNHSMFLYSRPIRIDQAVSDSDFVYVDSITQELAEDGYTAKNAVTDKLYAYPSASQIQEVIPSFNPDTQYILWYVIKRAYTPFFDGDAYVHVDGMIVKKPVVADNPPVEDNPPTEDNPPVEDNPPAEEVGSEDDNKPGEGVISEGGEQPGEEVISEDDNKPGEEVVSEDDNKPGEEIISEGDDDNKPEEEEKEKVSSELSFEVFSTNTQPQFEYDGEEHLIGGYVIRVTDSTEGEVAEYVYGPYGDFLGVTVRSVSFLQDIHVDGTVFTHRGVDYNVNVDSAFLLVRNPGTYEIPLFFKGMIMSPTDIIIRDEQGKVVDTAKLNVSTPSSSENVTKRKLTIEAGSTIQNDNGTTITNDNVKITSGSLLPGHKLVTSIVGSQTGPGESVNEITSYDIVDADGNSYKEMYDVTSNKGWLVLVKQSNTSDGQESDGSEQIANAGQDNKNNLISRVQSILGATRDDNVQSGILNGGNIETGILLSPDDENLPKVLGARRSDTSDITMPLEVRVSLVILCLMGLMIINIKRHKRL